MIFDILSPRGWSPFSDFDRLFDELSRTLPAHRGNQRVDVAANDQEALIALAAPGLRGDQVEVTIHGDTVTVKAPAPEAGADQGEWIQRERGQAGFERSVRLPFPVDEGRTTAAYADGVLSIRAPRLEASKPRRVAVTAT